MSLTCCQIDWACTHYLPPNCTFLGVLPSNYMPTKKDITKFGKHPIAFIINTDPSNMPGSHWLAFYSPFGEHSRLECFDSFGEPASNYGLVDNVAFNSISVNTTQFQANNTASCGFFCIFYILHRATRQRSISSILNVMHHVQPSKVDNYVKSFVKVYWPFPTTPEAHCNECCNQCSKSRNELFK